MPTRIEPKTSTSQEEIESGIPVATNDLPETPSANLDIPELPQPAPILELKGGSHLIRNIVLAILGAVVVFLIIVGLGIYHYGWTNPIITKTARILPYPIAAVNYRPIAYDLYLSDTDTLTHYYTKQQELNPSLYTMPTDNEIKSVVLTKLIKDTITTKLADSKDITISQSDIDAEYDKVAEQSGNPEGIEANIKELYNWDIPTFKEKVILPYLVRAKLQEKLSADTALNAEAKTLADSVLVRVKDGVESFEDIAKQFSQDESTAVNGGDLGYFGPGEMVESFEQAVAGLEVGKTSDLVQTPFGYHIIKLTEKSTDESGQPKYKASHILIRTKTVDDSIQDEVSKAKIWIFQSGFYWDTTQSAVLPDSAKADANANIEDTTDTNQASNSNESLNSNETTDTNTAPGE